MLKYEFLNNLSGVVLLICVTLVFVMLFESRYSKKTYLASLIPFLVIFFVVNIYLIFEFGFSEYGKYTIIFGTIPSFIYFFIVSENRDGRFIFTFCLVDTSVILFALTTGLIDYFCKSEGLVNIILRLGLTPLIFTAFYRWARKPYMQVLHTVTKGWWLFSGITMIAYALLVTASSIPTTLRERPEEIPTAVLIAILLPLIYFVIFYVIHTQQKLHDMGKVQQIFAAQSAMMKSKADEIKQIEENLRIERHDLRHKLNAVEEFAEKGDTENMIKYLGTVKKQLDETKTEHYCSNPVSDAILSHYFRMAKEAGIKVSAHLSIPDELPVPDAEFAVVFANAIENAIHANEKVEPEKREIVFNCICQPALMFEIKNPYVGKIDFDADGLPVSNKEGHGFGSRSVLAFCRKYDATYIYEAKNNEFRLMISL